MPLISLLVALAVAQSPATAQTGRISGRVTLSGTGAPVSGARITLFPGRPAGPFGPPPQAITGPDGRFAFDEVTPGTYRFDVQKAGLTSPDEASRLAPVTVTAGQAIEVSLQMQRGAAITGKILDSTGEPLTDARVMVLRRMPMPAGGAARGLPPMPRLIPAPTQGGQSNDLGEFRVSGLPPGEYFVAVTPRSAAMFGSAGTSPARAQETARTTLATTYYPGTTDQAAAQPIAVAAGAEVGNIFVTMLTVPAYRVSGIVVDEDGKPVADVMVMLMGDPRSGVMMGPAGNSMSRPDGQFDVDDVPAGSYRANGSIMMRMTESAGGRGGVTGGVSAGVVGAGASSFSWSSSSSSTRGTMPQPAEIVVSDADVTGVRVVVRRPARQ